MQGIGASYNQEQKYGIILVNEPNTKRMFRPFERIISMKKICKPIIISLIMSVFILTSCGKNDSSGTPQSDLDAFRSQVDAFCTSVANTDAAINEVDTSSEGYTTLIMEQLNSLNTSFSEFAALEFPPEYEYLKHLSVEASDYMSQAVSIYNQVYTDTSLSEADIKSKYEEASTLYSNAFKRIKVIMTFLNGEISEDANVSTEESGTLTEP